MNIDFVSLRTFLTVCEKQSLTEAARALGTTQSAISQRLKKLEDQTKFRLIDRGLRPVGPTAAGQALLERARRILAEVGKLEFELADRADLPIRELRIGIADSLGLALVAPLVQAIRSSVHQLAVRVDGSADLCQQLIERGLHAIVSSDPLQDRDDLERIDIYAEPMILVVPGHMVFGHDDGIERLQQLTASMPFIRYSPVSPLARQIETYLRRLGIQPPRNLEFNESETILDMVRHSLGWTITTPLCLLQARAALPTIGIYRLPAGGVSRSFTLMYRRNELGPLPDRLFHLCTTIIKERVVDRITLDLPWLAPHLSVAPRRQSFRFDAENLKEFAPH